MSGDSHNIESLITQYKESEHNVNKLSQIYDKLEQGLLEDTIHFQSTPSRNMLATKRANQSNSSLMNSKKTSSKLVIKNQSSSSSIPLLNSSSTSEDKLNISKAVERRIHQIENCRNILRQAKASEEKMLILESLSNNLND